MVGEGPLQWFLEAVSLISGSVQFIDHDTVELNMDDYQEHKYR